MYIKNKKFLSVFLTLVLFLGMTILPGQAAFAEEETMKLTVVHVNDVHGRVEEDTREGALGFSKLMTKVNMLREENPNLLFLNAGDVFHGTTIINVTQGETMVELMNIMGFDAMVPGNHDFNYGYDRLMELKELAEFPILGSNIVWEEDGTSDFDPYVVYEMENGLKVGIFGLGTDETKYKSHPKNTEGIEFTDVVEVGKEMVAELEALEVDFVIALVHLGIDASSVNTAKLVAEEVPGIDLIVDGHSHHELTEGELINDVLIVQAGSYTKNIGIVDIEFDAEGFTAAARLMPYEEAKDLEVNEEIDDVIAEIKVINDPIVSQVIGKTEVDLDGLRDHVRAGETNLGNLITDAMRLSTGADFALTNGGGIRESIPAGDITVNHVLTSFPFTNTLAVIEVTGQEVWDAIEHGVKDYPAAAGQFPHVSGLTYEFDANLEPLSRVTKIMIGGEEIDLTKTYTMVTNDFMASGGDGYTMFGGKPFVGEGGLLSDVLIEHITELETIAPEKEGRITATEAKKDIEYVVVKGDNLYRIGLKYNTTWQFLAEYNELSNPHLIFPNQIINVPQ